MANIEEQPADLLAYYVRRVEILTKLRDDFERFVQPFGGQSVDATFEVQAESRDTESKEMVDRASYTVNTVLGLACDIHRQQILNTARDWIAKNLKFSVKQVSELKAERSIAP